MKIADRGTQLALLSEANRAPSVHNTQPARWRFQADGSILLFEDARRRLLVADPTGHDAAISLGAAFEGLHLALSRRGAGLRSPDLMGQSVQAGVAPAGFRPVARSSLVATSVDSLAPFVLDRHTFRGRFHPCDRLASERLKAVLASRNDVIPLFGRTDIDIIAGLNDRCAYEFLRRPAYHAELYRWLRFTPRDPRWRRDGLTADCLALPPVARLTAAVLFRRGVFRALVAAHLAPLLIAERSKTRSAAAIVILTAEKSEDPFETGRRFYRVWLEICRAGFGACPMSALVDSAFGAACLRRYALPSGARIVNVFRVGQVLRDAAAISPRLPPEDLLV